MTFIKIDEMHRNLNHYVTLNSGIILILKLIKLCEYCV